MQNAVRIDKFFIILSEQTPFQALFEIFFSMHQEAQAR